MGLIFLIPFYFFLSACTGGGSAPTDFSAGGGGVAIDPTKAPGPKGNGNGYGGAIKIERIVFSTLTGKPGVKVTIYGSAFSGNTLVTVANQSCSEVVVVDPETITCHLAEAFQSVAVVEVSSHGVVAQKQFPEELPAPPRITNIVSGPSPNELTLTGTGFRAGAQVYVVEQLCLSIQWISELELKCTAPDLTASGSIRVENPNGQYALAENGYLYTPPVTGPPPPAIVAPDPDPAQPPPPAPAPDPLSVTGMNPSQGPAAGGTLVTITGTGFRPGVTVAIGSVPQLSVTLGVGAPQSGGSFNYLTFVTVGATPGNYSLTVTNLDGTQVVLTAPKFSYEPQGVWTPTSTVGAPQQRYLHTAVWTGSQLVVWGGWDSGSYSLNTGGRYDPATDSWSPTAVSAVAARRHSHSAVWSPDNNKMMIWGGSDTMQPNLNTGAQYDPVANTWTATTTTGAPTGRSEFPAIWTGSRVMIWGGRGTSAALGNGALYNPTNNTWTAITSVGAPSARQIHTLVKVGNKVIVFGGASGANFYGDGAIFDLATSTWSVLPTTNAPSLRGRHGAVEISLNRMVVWGGDNGTSNLNNGGIYDVGAGTWGTMSELNAPSPRSQHSMFWTGSAVIVYGGYTEVTGGVYYPLTDAWFPTAIANAPSSRGYYSAVWAGTRMIIWGGLLQGVTPTGQRTNTGAMYTPDIP